MLFDEVCGICNDLCSRSSLSAMAVCCHRATPSSLIECVYLNAALSEGGEQFVISIAMVVEAMNEDDFGDGRVLGLGSKDEQEFEKCAMILYSPSRSL